MILVPEQDAEIMKPVPRIGHPEASGMMNMPGMERRAVSSARGKVVVL
jgi:hypothetical protein